MAAFGEQQGQDITELLLIKNSLKNYLKLKNEEMNPKEKDNHLSNRQCTEGYVKFALCPLVFFLITVSLLIY
jgi:hypothetical protein